MDKFPFFESIPFILVCVCVYSLIEETFVPAEIKSWKLIGFNRKDLQLCICSVAAETEGYSI